jgi:hypothetical protein
MPGQRRHIAPYLSTIDSNCQFANAYAKAIHANANNTRYNCQNAIRHTLYLRPDILKLKFNILQNILQFYFLRNFTLPTPSAL